METDYAGTVIANSTGGKNPSNLRCFTVN